MKMAYDVRKATGRRNRTFAVVVEEVEDSTPLGPLPRFVDVRLLLAELRQARDGRSMTSFGRTRVLLEGSLLRGEWCTAGFRCRLIIFGWGF